MIEKRGGVVENDDIDRVGAKTRHQVGGQGCLVAEETDIRKGLVDEDRNIEIAVVLAVFSSDRTEEIRLENLRSSREDGNRTFPDPLGCLCARCHRTKDSVGRNRGTLDELRQRFSPALGSGRLQRSRSGALVQ